VELKCNDLDVIDGRLSFDPISGNSLIENNCIRPVGIGQMYLYLQQEAQVPGAQLTYLQKPFCPKGAPDQLTSSYNLTDELQTILPVILCWNFF
jgi:hypothetical protein